MRSVRVERLRRAALRLVMSDAAQRLHFRRHEQMLSEWSVTDPCRHSP